MSNLGQIDPITATAAMTAGSGLFSVVSGLFGKKSAVKAQEKIVRDQRAIQIREETQQRQILAAEQNRQARELVFGLSQQRRSEQQVLMTAVVLGGVVVSALLLYQALKKKPVKSTALARRR